MVGQTISHYRILEKLGEGGMGEVYRATDKKLNREVAIKLLPGPWGDDPGYLARFTREAQVLASLNHPNIAVIYGVEDRALVHGAGGRTDPRRTANPGRRDAGARGVDRRAGVRARAVASCIAT